MTTLSIVTITYNDDDGLARTLASLTELVHVAGDDLEVVVVDGGESVATRDLVGEWTPAAVLISEPDEGIYDAMNKGLDRVHGGHVWFLNGGDEALTDWTALRGVLAGNQGSVVLADYVLAGRTVDRARSSRPPRSMWHALPTSHQAIFYPLAGIGAARYDRRFGIVADYAFTADLYARDVPFARSSLPVARFHLDGVSNEHARLIGEQAGVVQREILRTALPLRLVSRLRHVASRRYRQILARR
ncbi:glycosyltransferase [Curtobacterium sp. ISL-83]|uniref:glycosyltransferase n=1 Tax=Curtobacterium sp. ISL-83 TaxID=2819145 RepID=UPI001BE936D0|nr:glycosyltransferase [Curtobacterium sp. ISL-83]MBT2502712.1 glycosyltransferase [Curtobacterium sp. ISL-83]